MSVCSWEIGRPHGRLGSEGDCADEGRHLAVFERSEGLRGIRIFDLPDWTVRHLDFPEPVYTVEAASNPEFDTDKLRFVYESPVTPPSVFDHDMTSGERELKNGPEPL